MGLYISLIVVVVLVWFLLDGQHLNQDDYNYAQFKQELADDEIKSVEVQPNRVYPTGRLDIVKTDKSEETLYVLDVSEAQSLMDKEKFTSYVVNDIPAENWLMNLLPLLLVFGAMFILFMIVMNNQAAGGGGGSKMMNFGKSRAKMTTDENRNVTFENVAGLREEKEELEEIVDFLKEPRSLLDWERESRREFFWWDLPEPVRLCLPRQLPEKQAFRSLAFPVLIS